MTGSQAWLIGRLSICHWCQMVGWSNVLLGQQISLAYHWLTVKESGWERQIKVKEKGNIFGYSIIKISNSYLHEHITVCGGTHTANCQYVLDSQRQIWKSYNQLQQHQLQTKTGRCGFKHYTDTQSHCGVCHSWQSIKGCECVCEHGSEGGGVSSS